MNVDDLRRSVQQSRALAIAAILVCVLSYFSYFYLRMDYPVGAPSDWGQFGDFIGGILNPIIAFFAFYWITQSILLQAKELQDTTKALTSSANSQTKQLEMARHTAEINALAGLLACYNTDISNAYRTIEFLQRVVAPPTGSSPGRTPQFVDDDGSFIRGETNVRMHIAEEAARLGRLTSERAAVMVRLDLLLADQLITVAHGPAPDQSVQTK